MRFSTHFFDERVRFRHDMAKDFPIVTTTQTTLPGTTMLAGGVVVCLCFEPSNSSSSRPHGSASAPQCSPRSSR
ncbi:MAG: hypothetical protein PHS57_06475 [Alphaproteobacteria bacterium]|nr:hypothetical protein [Alphaproteobacteria bacterium]